MAGFSVADAFAAAAVSNTLQSARSCTRESHDAGSPTPPVEVPALPPVLVRGAGAPVLVPPVLSAGAVPPVLGSAGAGATGAGSAGAVPPLRRWPARASLASSSTHRRRLPSPKTPSKQARPTHDALLTAGASGLAGTGWTLTFCIRSCARTAARPANADRGGLWADTRPWKGVEVEVVPGSVESNRAVDQYRPGWSERAGAGRARPGGSRATSSPGTQGENACRIRCARVGCASQVTRPRDA